MSCLAGITARWSTAYDNSRTKSFHTLVQGIDSADEHVVSVRVRHLVKVDIIPVLGVVIVQCLASILWLKTRERERERERERLWTCAMQTYLPLFLSPVLLQPMPKHFMCDHCCLVV
jgi:hypothetical protein